MEKQIMSFFEASKTPLEDLQAVSYPGQHPSRRQYQSGYEHWLERLPILSANDLHLKQKLQYAEVIMEELAQRLQGSSWIHDNKPEPHGFNRTIIAMESPVVACNGITGDCSYGSGLMVTKEGVELLVAKWGDHHASPVHGHSDGFLYEHILYGKMRVNTYRIVDAINRIVRPLRTDIATNGKFASGFMINEHGIERGNLIHNFVSIGQSASLHFVPEHTRDGRDNGFTVHHFEDHHKLTVDDVTRITSKDGLYQRKGEVIMVRSSNVPEYGDHFIVITGHPVEKEHGLRPQEISIQASSNGISILDLYDMEMGLTLLKLKPEARDKFLEFHDIQLIDDEIVFPAM